MTTQEFATALEEGQYILDEAKQLGIKIWIHYKTGSLLMKPSRGQKYFTSKLRECEYGVKLALEAEGYE